MKSYDLVVIGGGPGGIFGALTARERGMKVALLEKNKRIGNKILIAGSGKCNLTHKGNPKDFLDKYGENGKFLKEALNKFSPKSLRDFFQEKGLPLELVEESGKYFPNTFKSLDVINLLQKELEKSGVEIITQVTVKEVEKKESFIIKTDKGDFFSKNLLIATGGKSFAGVGTTGDGYIYAKSLGHKIKPPKPALTPIFIRDYKFSELSGVSFKNIEINFWKENKKILSKKGDVLFTHTNLSGPGILDNSRYVENGVTIQLNYLNMEFSKLLEIFLNESRENGKQSTKRFLLNLQLPERFVKTVLGYLEIEESKKIAELSKEKRDLLLKEFTEKRNEITRVGDFEVAMVTKGGVALEEINPKTMESKIVKGLFFAGEVVDIDGDTGGYNIQGACSMGVLAGRNM